MSCKALALKTRAAANLFKSKGLAPTFFNDLPTFPALYYVPDGFLCFFSKPLLSRILLWESWMISMVFHTPKVKQTV